MNKCPQCGIILYKDTEVCPLCSCVTEVMEDDKQKAAVDAFSVASPYPDVYKKTKILRFVLKLVLFIFVVAEAVMVLINYLTPVSYPWSLITGLSLLYIYLFLLYWISHDSGFAAKVGFQMLITMGFLLAIDYLNGMHGWSLQWAIPSIILAGDAIVFILMVLNKSRWQSYLLLLLLMGACSLGILGLFFAGKISSIVMPVICAGISCLYSFGALLFGGKTAGYELKRRVHI
ncbi:MAG: hypothetical protein K6A38_07020 [Lachnospiraceae bacterium]|nr:hypothetical protein [Lachnospiraceae bacterium]